MMNNNAVRHSPGRSGPTCIASHNAPGVEVDVVGGGTQKLGHDVKARQPPALAAAAANCRTVRLFPYYVYRR